jgi:hypothetical protein
MPDFFPWKIQLRDEVIAEARKGAETMEDDELTVGHPIEDLSHEALVLHQVVIGRIRSALLAGDAGTLNKLDQYIDQFDELHPGHHKQFDKLIAKARTQLPKRSALAPTVFILERLSELTPCT